jgi:uncharacterized OB-fold protein
MPATSDQDVFDQYPNVLLNYDNIEHFRGLLEHRLLINRCQDSGHWIYPHRPLCPECWSTNVVPTEVSGKGFVYMYMILYQGRAVETGLEYPHVKAAVELAEQPGLRYLAPLVNCAPEQARNGMPVQLTWVELDGAPAAAFEPVTG